MPAVAVLHGRSGPAPNIAEAEKILDAEPTGAMPVLPSRFSPPLRFSLTLAIPLLPASLDRVERGFFLGETPLFWPRRATGLHGPCTSGSR